MQSLQPSASSLALLCCHVWLHGPNSRLFQAQQELGHDIWSPEAALRKAVVPSMFVGHLLIAITG